MFNSRRRLTESSLFDRGFAYSTKLSAHSSCINALAFSSQGGRFLASGGDDLQVHLWDLHQEDVVSPCHTFIGPRANIFNLAFSCTNKYLFAGGTDTMIHQFDVAQLESLPANEQLPKNMFRENESVRDVTCHPFQDEVFLCGSENGRIVQHDLRVKYATNPVTRAQDIIQLTTEVSGVQYHPTMEHVFATSDNKGVVCLRDTRMGFGPRKTRTREGIIHTYNTKLAKRNVSHLSNPESSSITFDREGRKLAVTMLYYNPTIYALSDPNPIAVCSSRNFPDGSPIPSDQRSYSNSCTMKHGCFGGPDTLTADYYCAGSDDFCGYLWKMPSVETLVEQREEISADEWSSETSTTIGFAESFDTPRYIPAQLSTPSAILKGHKSIVNTTLIHPQFPLILTAGIERDISLHSPTPSCPFSQRLEPTPQEVRQLTSSPSMEEDRVVNRLVLGSDPVDSEDAETDTIRLFDRFLRLEGETDPFDVRRYEPSD